MFQELLEKIAAALAERGLPYMVIGGQAVLLYGEPRLTRDIDVTLGVDADRLAEALEAASAAGLTPLVADPGRFVRETHVLPLIHGTSGIRVDLVFSWTQYEQEAIRRANRVRIGRTEVSFASLEDLLIHKIVAGRPRDLEDARQILLKNPDFDRQYVERWLGEFDKALSTDHVDSLARLLATIGHR